MTGSVTCTRLLKAAMSSFSAEGTETHVPVGLNAPVDMAGRTPIGWALAEADPHGPKDSKDVYNALTELKELLYADGDWSVCPRVPASGRGTDGEGAANELAYGHGDIPGWRVTMEDTVCCHYPVEGGVDGCEGDPEGFGLFGVFDGHGGSDVSEFLGDRFRDFLVETEAWKKWKGKGGEGKDDGV